MSFLDQNFLVAFHAAYNKIQTSHHDLQGPACFGLHLPLQSHLLLQSILLDHSTVDILTFFLLFEKIKLVSSSKILHFMFPLPGILFLQLFAQQSPSHHSGLCSNITTSEKPSQVLPFLHSPSLLSSLCIPLTFSSYHWSVSNIIIFKSFRSSLSFSLNRM